MQRQIYKTITARSGTETDVPLQKGTKDYYFDRLMKLIPAETIAVFLFIEGILKSALTSPAQSVELQIWLWMTFGLLFIGNILYLWQINRITHIVQLIILSLAFAVWVFTLGGPFIYLSFYRPFIGSILLGLYTFFAPIFYRGVPVTEPVE